MTFEDELRRVVDHLAEHLRHEAAGRLQAAMPELYDASQSEQKAAVAEALQRAREEAERDFAERIDAVKREASEQVTAAQREAEEKAARSEQQAAEQLEAARREHADRVEALQRESAEQLEARDRETAAQLDARSREAAERLEAREREIGGLLEAKNREAAERLEAIERQAMEHAEAASREAAERLERLESAAAQRAVHDGRNEGRDALAESIGRMGKARSLSEVLEALIEAARREVPSVAVVLSGGDHVKTWRLAGFNGHAEQAAAVTLSLQEAGVIREAIQSGSVARGTSENPLDIPGFADSMPQGPRSVAAFPLIVGGSTVAVVYGDAPEDGGATWQTSLEALASCASRSLETITAFRTATLLAQR